MAEKYYKASNIVHKLSVKYSAKKLWIWDLLEDEFGMIKGHGWLMTKEEAEILEQLVIDGLAGLY